MSADFFFTSPMQLNSPRTLFLTVPQVWGKRSGQTGVIPRGFALSAQIPEKNGYRLFVKTARNEYHYVKEHEILHETPAWTPK